MLAVYSALPRIEKGQRCAPAQEWASWLTTIGFDADDTLWHHETFYRG